MAGLRLGRGLADRRRTARAAIATSGRSATTQGRERRRARRDDRAPRPPPPAVEAVDPAARRHAAVRRPGGPLRLQPQRRPARLPALARPRIGRRAGSTAGPTRRSARAGSRTRGRAETSRSRHLLRGTARPVRRPGQPRACSTPTATRVSLRRQRREPGLLLPPRPDRRRLDRASTRSTGRSSGSSRRAPPSAAWCASGPSRSTDSTECRRGRSTCVGGASPPNPGGGVEPDDRHEACDRGRPTAPWTMRRPTAMLPIASLLRISLYWLGLTAIDAGGRRRPPGRVEFDLVDDPVPGHAARARRRASRSSVGRRPADVGSISDYTSARWGRRKPYIVIGSLLDVVFLLGIATSQHAPRARGVRRLLRSSARTSRSGPFQGYVPGPRRRAAGRPGQRAGRADAGPRQRDRASSSAPSRSPHGDFGSGDLRGRRSSSS